MSDSGGGRDGYHMNHPNQGGAGGGNECRSPYGGGSAQNVNHHSKILYFFNL
jgi:hypothetical protein